MPPVFFFFLKITLAIWGLSCFYTNLRVICFIFVKNAIGILIRIALNLQTALDSTDILTILILPNPESAIPIYLCLLQLLSSISCSFQYTSLSPPWLNLFIPKYFIFCYSYKQECFLPDSWLLVRRNATDFWCVVS